MERTAVDRLMTAVVTWIVDRDSYVTKTKLLKLVYLFDVEYYRQHRRTFTGFSWKFFHLGPWAPEYDSVLEALLADGLLAARRSTSSEYDSTFYRPVQRMQTGSAVASAGDESILLGVLKRWGTCTTGEILNFVYFQTEPMESAIRSQPLDFSAIGAERRPVYTRSSSGRTSAEVRKMRERFEQTQAHRKAAAQQPFTFTPPQYDDEYFDAIGKLQTA